MRSQEEEEAELVRAGYIRPVSYGAWRVLKTFAWFAAGEQINAFDIHNIYRGRIVSKRHVNRYCPSQFCQCSQLHMFEVSEPGIDCKWTAKREYICLTCNEQTVEYD